MKTGVDPPDTTRSATAYREIKRRIIELDMAPGSAFTESELAADLGISKTPTREALARLQVAGFVEVIPRSGYRVTPVTLQSARDLFGARFLLECEAAALAAGNAVDLKQLLVLEQLRTVGFVPDDRDSVRHFIRANNEFHLALARVGGNEYLVTLLAAVLEPLERLFYLGLTLTSRADEIVHEHTDLLEAVKLGDAEGARRIAATQAAASQKMVVDALISSGSFASSSAGDDSG